MGKAEKCIFLLRLCDMIWKRSQPLSLLISRVYCHLVTLAKGHLPGIFFLSETTRPGCNADHHFGTVTLCQQNM